MPTVCKDALKALEDSKKVRASDLTKVELWGQIPPIEKMDASLATLKSCTHLSLSSNNIEKISNLAGMDSLKILSLARNQIKKIENLEAVAETLQELWISYNLLEKLTNLEKLSKLRVLFLSNNKIGEWAEIERLAQLPALEDLLLVGNPLTEKYNVSAADNPSKPGSTWRLAVLQRLPGLKKLDGILVDREEVEQAAAQKAVS